MKTRILGCIFLLMCSAYSHAGTYDGVWTIDAEPFKENFYMLYQRDGQLLMVGLEGDMNSWEAFIGPISTNRGNLRILLSPEENFDLNAVLEFSSSTTGTVNILSCSGDCQGIPLNQPLPFNKFY